MNCLIPQKIKFLCYAANIFSTEPFIPKLLNTTFSRIQHMQFGTGYFGPERNYYTLTGASVADAYVGTFPGNKGPNIEGTQTAQVGVKELGMSVTEGSRFGSLVQTTSQAIRLGVGKIELATIQGGSEPGGAEGYGHEARLALRELAKANTVSYTSFHTPANTVGNLSGYNYQERGFNDEYRHKKHGRGQKSNTVSRRCWSRRCCCSYRRSTTGYFFCAMEQRGCSWS